MHFSTSAGTVIGGSFVKPVTSSVQVASLVKAGCGDPVDDRGAPKFTSCAANGADCTRAATTDPTSATQVGWRIGASALCSPCRAAVIDDCNLRHAVIW